MNLPQQKKYNLTDTKRTLFIKELFSRLQEKEIKFCVIRGHEGIFEKKESDIDILMSPSNYQKMFSLYLQLLDKFDGKLFSSSVSNKNYYIRSLFITETSSEPLIEGLYIHISAYITIKRSQKEQTIKLCGKHIWIDNINIIDSELDKTIIPIPEYKAEIMFLLSAYLQKGRKKYLTQIKNILQNKNRYTEISNKKNIKYLEQALKSDSVNTNIPELYGLCGELTKDTKKLTKTFVSKQYTTLLWLNTKHVFKYKGKLIFFSGPDGSGKTTANNALTALLREKLKVNIYNSKHLYPISNRLSKQVTKIQAKARKVPLSDKDTLERDRGDTRLWKARRFVGLLYVLIQVYPGYFMARYKNWKGQTVIIDTSFFDAFIKGHRPSFPLLQKLSVPLIPCGDKWFLMKASPTEIVARKPELSIDELTSYYNSLDDIARRSTCSPIKIPSNKGESLALKLMIEGMIKSSQHII